jgi:hypothetical protein
VPSSLRRKTELAEQSLTLVHAELNGVLLFDPRSQSFAIPQIHSHSRITGLAPQHAVDFLHLRRIQARWPARSFSFHESGQPLHFKPTDSILHGSRRVTEQMADFRTRHPLCHQQHAVQFVVISRLFPNAESPALMQPPSKQRQLWFQLPPRRCHRPNDQKHLVAHVEPAEDLPGRSTWLGSSQGLSFEICQSMRQILLHSTTALSHRAAEPMELLVAQGTTDPAEPSSALPARTGCEWWTYAGLKANAALVQRFGLPASFDSLTIRARCSPIELNRALDAPPEEASPEIDQRFLPKFAECIPNNLLAQFASQCLYDWSAANEICQLPLIYTSESA